MAQAAAKEIEYLGQRRLKFLNANRIHFIGGVPWNIQTSRINLGAPKKDQTPVSFIVDIASTTSMSVETTLERIAANQDWLTEEEYQTKLLQL